MVHPMVDNFSECKFVNSGTVVATGDHQQPISTKKLALRDAPNESADLKSPVNSPLQNEKTPVADIMKVSSIQKHQPCFLASPSRSQLLVSNGVTGHLVYVRRKLETDSGRINDDNSASRKYETESGMISENSSGSPPTKKSRTDCMSEPVQNPDLTQVPGDFPLLLPTSMPTSVANISSAATTPSNSNGLPMNGLPVPESNCLRASVGFHVQPAIQSNPAHVPCQPESQSPGDQPWRERFNQLQIYLKACDQMSPEEYIQKLRSLSAAERSRHAFELERRAIQLTLEEGKELHRVRLLNVLNKLSANQHGTAPAKAGCSPMQVATRE